MTNKAGEQPTITQSDIELADAVAEAIASVQIAYSHNTNAEFRTVDRKWSVHDACEGNPFEKDEWLAVFTDKEEAHEFARNLRQERAANAVARHRTTSLAAQDGLVERIVRDVAELPDRTSPEDWPDAMLVTADELAAIVAAALSAIKGDK